MKRYLIKASFLAYFLIPLLPYPTAANECDSLSTFVQQQRISGRVLNASGRGLANVSIQVKGTTVGTSTGPMEHLVSTQPAMPPWSFNFSAIINKSCPCKGKQR